MNTDRINATVTGVGAALASTLNTIYGWTTLRFSVVLFLIVNTVVSLVLSTQTTQHRKRSQ